MEHILCLMTAKCYPTLFPRTRWNKSSVYAMDFADGNTTTFVANWLGLASAQLTLIQATRLVWPFPEGYHNK